jgi:hypothetical protein
LNSRGSARDVAMLWRVRATGDGPGVGSDVLNLTGMSAATGTHVQSSWDAFAAANGVTDANVGNFLGSYGVDVAHHQVWAEVNHNSQFACRGARRGIPRDWWATETPLVC